MTPVRQTINVPRGGAPAPPRRVPCFRDSAKACHFPAPSAAAQEGRRAERGLLVVAAYAAAVALAAGTCPGAAPPDRLVGLDGSVREGTVNTIDDAGRVRLAGGETVRLDGLRRIVRGGAAEAPAEAPARAVFPSAGGVLHARDVTFDGNVFAVDLACGGALRLPLAAVRAVRLRPAGPDDAAAVGDFETARTAADVRRDRLFALVDGGAQVVRGALVAVEPDHVRFTWNEAERRVGRDKVFGIVLAHTGPNPDRTGRSLVHLADGSRCWMAVRRLADGRLDGTVSGGPALSVPWSGVVRMDVRSPRLVFLSDLDPVAVQQTALVTYAGPWRRDRSVVGGPLSLRGRVYDKGLGVHSRCRLVYELGRRFDTFAATIGLDDSTDGRGDCVFVVETDGAERFRRRIRGADAPHAVRLSVAGARRLALTVEWGEDLDLADRADWCDARLLKAPSK